MCDVDNGYDLQTRGYDKFLIRNKPIHSAYFAATPFTYDANES